MKSKTKKVVEYISDVSSGNESDTKFEIVVDSYKADKKQLNQSRVKKKLTPIMLRKHLWRVKNLKNYKEKLKNLVPNHLIILIEKIINM